MTKLNYPRIILWVLAIIYVVSPADFMPLMPWDDILALLVAGYADRKLIVRALQKLKKK